MNVYAEYSLHAQLKDALSGPGDRFEVEVEGKVVDLVKADGELVEVQTRNLGAIVPKVLALVAAGRKVRVVHPVAAELRIGRLDPSSGEISSTRRSPKKGDIYSMFDELVRAPSLIAARNVSVEAVLVRVTEYRTRDGSGSWWRRGDRTTDRVLEQILERRRFKTRRDWLALIPKASRPPYDSLSLGEKLGISPSRARKVLYCLSRAGLLVETGRSGRRKVYGRRA